MPFQVHNATIIAYRSVVDWRKLSAPSASGNHNARRKVPPCIPTDYMTLWKRYFSPQTITEAVDILSNSHGTYRILAGGTDLLLDISQGRIPPIDGIVDVTGITALQKLEMRGSDIFIGACVSLRKLALSSAIKSHCYALYEAVSLIGGPQVRNVATLGGNVAHAMPAADGSIALLALGAQAEIASIDGSRLISIEGLFTGPGKSSLNPGELIVGFYIPISNSLNGSYFTRIMRPQGVALPILNTAIWLEGDSDAISQIRIALGPAGTIPKRAFFTEKQLIGKRYSDCISDNIETYLVQDVKFRSSKYRASEDYRSYLAPILLMDCLQKAWAQAFLA